MSARISFDGYLLFLPLFYSVSVLSFIEKYSSLPKGDLLLHFYNISSTTSSSYQKLRSINKSVILKDFLLLEHILKLNVAVEIPRLL